MTEKKEKKVNKKALEYVRPAFGSFNLKAFPGFEFKFKKISIDDESWVKQNMGRHSWEIINSDKAEAAELCRLYFHFLENEGKTKFPPETIEEMDYETGEKKSVLLNGPKKFMQSIDGGSLTEMLLIAQAFLMTMVASRPMSDLPEDLKKTVLESIKRRTPKEKEPEANP